MKPDINLYPGTTISKISLTNLTNFPIHLLHYYIHLLYENQKDYQDGFYFQKDYTAELLLQAKQIV